MNSSSIDMFSDRLMSMVDWDKHFPEYIFVRKDMKGFLALDSGIVSTRGFLEFMCEFNADIYSEPLVVQFCPRVGVRANGVVTFLCHDATEIGALRQHPVNSSASFMDWPIIACSPSMKWVAFEDRLEDLTVIAVFDERGWESISASNSGIYEYAASSAMIKKALERGRWAGMNEGFIQSLLEAYAVSTV